MKLAAKTAKIDIIKSQLINLLELDAKDIVATPTYYNGITLITVNESSVTTLSSIRNIEAILLNDATAAELLQSTSIRESPSLRSLNGVDEREQYEHLSQLLYMKKTTRDKR